MVCNSMVEHVMCILSKTWQFDIATMRYLHKIEDSITTGLVLTVRPYNSFVVFLEHQRKVSRDFPQRARRLDASPTVTQSSSFSAINRTCSSRNAEIIESDFSTHCTKGIHATLILRCKALNRIDILRNIGGIVLLQSFVRTTSQSRMLSVVIDLKDAIRLVKSEITRRRFHSSLHRQTYMLKPGKKF